MRFNRSNIELLLLNLYHENADVVKHTLEEMGRDRKGDHESVKALQEFLRRELRMPLRILAAQTISMIQKTSLPTPKEFKKPDVFQCPGAEKVKRVEIIDVTCPHCRKEGTASVAGFEQEFACEVCGAFISREVPESCIEKCPVGSACVGEDRYQKYLKGRKKVSI